MIRVLLLLLIATACSSREERARQAVEFRQARDSLLTTEVVRALQPHTSVGRLIYDSPTGLARDSMRVDRP